MAEGVGQLQRIYPDGFKIDRPSRTLIAGEIEHQHPVKGGRLKTYARLWHLFDAHDRWSFRLLVMDTRDYHLRELDLSVIWINGLAGDDIVSSRGGLRTTAAAKACSCGAAWGHKPACALRLGA